MAHASAHRLVPSSLVITLVITTLAAACGGNTGRTPPRDASVPGDMVIPPGADLRMQGCAKATYAAQQSPAAMLIVLDRSSSMADSNKWAFAAQAIVQAIDQDLFDSMHVGLYAAPSANRTGPACIFNLPVACQAPAFPQIDLQLAGTKKSTDMSGVRRDIRNWLTNNSPDNGAGDASPLYDAVQASLLALQGWNVSGKRILFVVTDGTISCNQFSNRPGFPDCNGCTRDWEDPNNIVQLLAKANTDPNKPVETFIVGVPGADTFDAQGCNYPPYHMRAALSAIAAAGSPANIPSNCTGKLFSQSTPDPQVSCHVDLTQGNFNAGAIATTISQVRGKVLGCTFELPKPDVGMVDPDLVNVAYSTAGGMPVDLFRRKDKSNPCTTGNGCWDYTTDGKVQLIGKACDDVKTANNAKVDIVVGCATIIG